MDDENQTGTSQLIILVVITILSFLFVPRFRQLASMSEAEIAAAMQKTNRIEQEREHGSDEYKRGGYERFKQQMEEMERMRKQRQDSSEKRGQDTTSAGGDNSYSGKYPVASIPPEIDGFFSQYGYKQKAASGKKLVIYSNMPGKNDDEKEARIKIFRSYSVSPEWNKKYTFVEAKFNESTMHFDSQDDYKSFLKFNVDCGYFCIIDYNNNLLYTGEKSADSSYIYSVMSDFYK